VDGERRTQATGFRSTCGAGKSTLVIFDLGRPVKPCVTPDEPDRVIELLRSRVPVGGDG